MLNCPNCKSSTVYRSPRRKFTAKVMSILNRWPYRCYICGTRFYLSLSSRKLVLKAIAEVIADPKAA